MSPAPPNPRSICLTALLLCGSLSGATGFTGQLCVKYLSKNANDINWAIAGRNKGKLEDLKSRLSLDVDIFIADSDDHEALDEITKNTKVVLSTAGPFHRYSSNLVKSCVKNLFNNSNGITNIKYTKDIFYLYMKILFTKWNS